MVKSPSYAFERVMIIDDNELDNFISKRIILNSRFSRKVYEHTSATSALEFLQNIKIAGLANSQLFPEVIIVDLNMPTVDGFQFLELYKKMAAEYSLKSKLVVLTSSVQREDEVKVRTITQDIVFLRKPLKDDMLERI